jgi:hypothetical protein
MRGSVDTVGMPDFKSRSDVPQVGITKYSNPGIPFNKLLD